MPYKSQKTLAMNHYNSDYFKWQQSIGYLAGSANRFMYQPYIDGKDVVLDFGCGGGYLLGQLECSRRLGIEINPDARATALTQGIEVSADVSGIPCDSVDVIISQHALEHTLRPYDTLCSLRAVLRSGGRLVVVVPFERNAAWRPGDVNQHLYTWSPMNLGNLITIAGFRVEASQIIYHRFPPKAQILRRAFGPKVFHWLCLIWGHYSRSVVQVRVVAIKE